MAKKRRDYHCPSASCPRPADYVGYPALQSEVVKEWASRLAICRSGEARKRRAAAKAKWAGNKAAMIRGKSQGKKH